jgi:hypothetical protein
VALTPAAKGKPPRWVFGGNGFGRRLLQASTQAQAMRSQYVFWLDKQNTIWYLL